MRLTISGLTARASFSVAVLCLLFLVGFSTSVNAQTGCNCNCAVITPTPLSVDSASGYTGINDTIGGEIIPVYTPCGYCKSQPPQWDSSQSPWINKSPFVPCYHCCDAIWFNFTIQACSMEISSVEFGMVPKWRQPVPNVQIQMYDYNDLDDEDTTKLDRPYSYALPGGVLQGGPLQSINAPFNTIRPCKTLTLHFQLMGMIAATNTNLIETMSFKMKSPTGDSCVANFKFKVRDCPH